MRAYRQTYVHNMHAYSFIHCEIDTVLLRGYYLGSLPIPALAPANKDSLAIAITCIRNKLNQHMHS